VDTVQADLTDLTQVHRLADEVLDRYPQLHGLVNNAGVGFGAPGADREVSAQGIELRFAVNHLASYLLARRLADRMVASAAARTGRACGAPASHPDLGAKVTTRVLVVDDDPHILRAIRVHLTASGYAVSTAQTGCAALRAGAAEPPDLYSWTSDCPTSTAPR
jgi:NAD(P)-dependent dehydrogenase (short-subunit alcohol dehydrogenase family)